MLINPSGSNQREINQSQQDFHRVQMLHNFHKFYFIGLVEPFQHVRQINKYIRRLRMPLVKQNCNGKIWVIINSDFDVTVVRDTKQQLTLFYAKCTSEDRLMLWEDIYQMAETIDSPWLIGGNFNVVLNVNEKIGGLPVQEVNHDNFKTCIQSCDLLKMKFKCSPFTWWNGRVGNDCIFERLDKVFLNQHMRN
ncbi:hypothetical protein H5410_036598 [Solanum commersonii]|uniref:Uncharacterized protein n=1 Tax=Solanum commersonii TaxID=4109 RepID=A0A9J5Y8N3_SOLCO|nr:hypothetical protein H5410_036598 [Solanum commersonii]